MSKVFWFDATKVDTVVIDFNIKKDPALFWAMQTSPERCRLHIGLSHNDYVHNSSNTVNRILQPEVFFNTNQVGVVFRAEKDTQASHYSFKPPPSERTIQAHGAFRVVGEVLKVGVLCSL